MKENKHLSFWSNGEGTKAQDLAWKGQRRNERGCTRAPVCGLHDW